MFKLNKNRGAGLVTVVVVMAIASILLAWTILLSFTHYKNAIQAEKDQQNLAEVELCAELIYEALTQGASIDNLLLVTDGKNLLQTFYEGGCSEVTDGEYLFEDVRITIVFVEEKTYKLTVICDTVTKVYQLVGEKQNWAMTDWQEVSQ